MARDDATDAAYAETAAGAVEYLDTGEGPPVLFVHGSPGGCDQGRLMTGFVVNAGHRVVALSRPGYLGTPLDESNRTPDQQAALALALADTLGLDRFAVMCWSGGGPSSYRLAALHPDRVTVLVALAAVSHAYTFASPAEENLLTGGFGTWLMKEMVRHTPKQVVKMMAGEEGDLSKDQVKELTEHIWREPTKRAFVLDLMATVTGHRKDGLRNDEHRFPEITDLGLEAINSPTLLVHGTVDSDVPPVHSDVAHDRIPGSELLAVDNGTHIATWTDPTSDAIQDRIVTFLRAAATGA